MQHVFSPQRHRGHREQKHFLFAGRYRQIKTLSHFVANRLIVELKACESLQPIHEAQLLTYLKLTGIKVGLLINFNVPVLKEGIKDWIKKIINSVFSVPLW